MQKEADCHFIQRLIQFIKDGDALVWDEKDMTRHTITSLSITTEGKLQFNIGQLEEGKKND